MNGNVFIDKVNRFFKLSIACLFAFYRLESPVVTVIGPFPLCRNAQVFLRVELWFFVTVQVSNWVGGTLLLALKSGYFNSQGKLSHCRHLNSNSCDREIVIYLIKLDIYLLASGCFRMPLWRYYVVGISQSGWEVTTPGLRSIAVDRRSCGTIFTGCRLCHW